MGGRRRGGRGVGVGGGMEGARGGGGGKGELRREGRVMRLSKKS